MTSFWAVMTKLVYAETRSAVWSESVILCLDRILLKVAITKIPSLQGWFESCTWLHNMEDRFSHNMAQIIASRMALIFLITRQIKYSCRYWSFKIFLWLKIWNAKMLKCSASLKKNDHYAQSPYPKVLKLLSHCSSFAFFCCKSTFHCILA